MSGGTMTATGLWGWWPGQQIVGCQSPGFLTKPTAVLERNINQYVLLCEWNQGGVGLEEAEKWWLLGRRARARCVTTSPLTACITTFPNLENGFQRHSAEHTSHECWGGERWQRCRGAVFPQYCTLLCFFDIATSSSCSDLSEVWKCLLLTSQEKMHGWIKEWLRK